MIETTPLATVDLRAPGAAANLREAGAAIGAFYLVGHGVAGALIDAHFELAREFFALDDAVKYAIAVQPGTAFRATSRSERRRSTPMHPAISKRASS
jgi:isopenicillin N synthase-like dioxygenase